MVETITVAQVILASGVKVRLPPTVLLHMGSALVSDEPGGRGL